MGRRFVMDAEKLKEYLEKIVSGGCWPYDGDMFVVDDYADGNVDDAYWGGCRSGEVQLAKYLLKEFCDF